MAPSPYQAFVNKKLAEKFPPKKNETDALLGLFSGSVDDVGAATQYTSDINSTQKERDVQAKLWRIWILLQDTAAQFPEQHEKLVDMVAAISGQPDHIVNSHTLVKWSELPILSSQWREGLFNWGESHKLSERVNLTAFTAKLSTRSLEGTPSITASETDLQIAFEQSTDVSTKLDSAAIRDLEANVPVAAQWILFAGNEIYNCKEVTNGQSGALWKGPPGFSTARWDFWKTRAQWISEQQKLSKAIREVAGDLLAKMDEIEIAAYS